MGWCTCLQHYGVLNTWVVCGSLQITTVQHTRATFDFSSPASASGLNRESCHARQGEGRLPVSGLCGGSGMQWLSSKAE